MAEERKTGHAHWLTANVVLLSLSSLFGDISTEMLYPVLPVFLTQVLGPDGSVVGLIDGVAQATQNIVQGLSGTLSDRLRARKPVALVGFLLAAISKPLMGLVGTWPGVFAARVLDRVGAGTRSAPRDAMIAGSVTEDDRGKAFGLEGFGDNLGAFLGPLISVVLLTAVDMRLIFYIAMVPGMLAFVAVLFVRETSNSAVLPKVSLQRAAFPRAYRSYVLAVAIFAVGNSSSAFLILRTLAAGTSLSNTILIYAGFNLVAALVSYPTGMLSDRLGRRALLLVGLAILFLTYLGFAVAADLATLALLFVSYGIYQGIFRAAGKALAADLVPERMRAGGIGWYNAAVGFSQLVASVVAGLLWDRVNHAAPFVYGAAFALAGGVALFALVPARPPAPGSQ